VCEAWSAEDAPSLGPIVAAIHRVIARFDDLFLARLIASPGLEGLYESHQARMKAEFRRFAGATV
jgi:hypothetical protein